VVTLGENGVREADILIHDETLSNPVLHYMLARMQFPDFPVAMGVIRKVEKNVYDQSLNQQRIEEQNNSKFESLNDLFLDGNTFVVN